MADAPSSVTRFLHVKFRAPTADTTQLLPLMKAALPMLEALGARVRLMRNADDHSQILQIIEYQMDPALEASRQKVASDIDYAQTSRTVGSGFAGYTADYGSHGFQANIRYDDNSQFGGHTTGSIGYGYRFDLHWRFRRPSASGMGW